MMGMRFTFVAAIIISVTAIKVPVEEPNENATETKTQLTKATIQKPVYYESDEEQVDSYLVPPNPHRPAEGISDDIVTPATYLLPPSKEKLSDYYKPTEAGEQTDWYPIAPAASPLYRGLLPPKESEANPILTVANQSEPIFGTFRTGKVLESNRYLPVPSRDLQPPLEDAPNEYVALISDQSINLPFKNERPPPRPSVYPLQYWNGPIIFGSNNLRAIPLAQIPYNTRKIKNPTNLYPKKYGEAFKPVPIPLAQFTNKPLAVPKAKPLIQFKPNQIVETELETPDEKKVYKYEEAHKKRKLKGEFEAQKEEEPEINETDEEDPLPEQDTSATNYRVPLRNLYPAPLRQSQPPAPSNLAQSHKPPANGERTEFRMHGMKGPHSYQFGFDTGKGKNRQFRYEERDNDGHVKGHYGYMDRQGKLRVVNYDADPEHGFRAEAPVESEINN